MHVGPEYVLRDDGIENVLHLLIFCPFSSPAWKKRSLRLGNHMAPIHNNLVDFVLSSVDSCNKSKKGNITISKLCFPTFTHVIWGERNKRLLGGERNSLQNILCDILNQIRSRTYF